MAFGRTFLLRNMFIIFLHYFTFWYFMKILHSSSLNENTNPLSDEDFDENVSSITGYCFVHILKGSAH